MSKIAPSEFEEDLTVAALDDEIKLIRRNSDDHSVKLENDGDTWQIRFLPAELGPRKLFFARVAQHWINKKPYVCSKVTSPDFGGIPDFDCPLCTLAESLNNSTNREVSSVGYRSAANPQWLTYCLVWSKASAKDEWYPDGDEQWTPYKFFLNKQHFDEVREYYLRALKKRPSQTKSILDPYHGVDFIVRKKDKKLVLQKDEARSIFPEGTTEEEEGQILDRIFEQIKVPHYEPLTNEEMDAALNKLEEAGFRAKSANATGQRRQAAVIDDEDNLDEDRGPRRSQAKAPEPTPKVSRPSFSRSESTRSVPASKPAQAQATIPSARPQARLKPADVPEQLSPSERIRQASRQQARAAAPAQSTGPAVSSVDDDDDVTAEAHDHAPQSRDLSVIEGDDLPTVQDEPNEEPPPAPVERVQQPSKAGSKMSDRLRSAITRVSQ